MLPGGCRRWSRWVGQLFLGDTLDTEHIDAGYDAGVLTLRIPIAEKAKPRKISIANTDSGVTRINA